MYSTIPFFIQKSINRLFALFMFTLLSTDVLSHELSNGYLTLNSTSDNALAGELLLKPEDIGRAAGLDIDNNGTLTWGEVNRHHSLANNYIQSNVVISDNGQRCALFFWRSAGRRLKGCFPDVGVRAIPSALRCSYGPARSANWGCASLRLV